MKKLLVLITLAISGCRIQFPVSFLKVLRFDGHIGPGFGLLVDGLPGEFKTCAFHR